MEDGLLSLKWNNHKTTFFEILRILREKSNYTDATLAVEGKFYPVHKLVMSTCSEYFSDIFERTPCKSPVIVLKDVRSHDIEALLDYMYLGEVNVNQNDLSSLLKTAECLRIKGLAVPDEDPTPKVRKNSTSSHDDVRRDSPPPPKRRRHDSNPLPIPPRAVSPVPPPPKSATALVNPAQTTPIPPPPPPAPHSAPSTPNTEQDDLPVVKVELDDDVVEEPEERFRRENNYEGSASSDRDLGGDYGPDLSKTEHEPENYGNASFPGPSIQQSGESHWDEGDSSSFPPESYSGDVPTSQQAQGVSEDEDDDDEDDDDTHILTVDDGNINSCSLSVVNPGMVPTSQGSPGEPPPLTPISQARQCQLCLVTLANANLLRRHVEDHHFHIRKYDCIHCGKKFKRKEHRERHERIHTGEKPFACHICTARFTQKEHLKGHIENVHHKHDKDRGIKGDMTMSGDHIEKDGIDVEDGEDDADNPTITVTSVNATTGSPLSSPPSLNSLSGMSSFIPTTSTTSLLPTVLPTSSLLSTTSGAPPLLPPVMANDLNMNQFTALYAPVNRKTVNSPNKHMQTITINFN